MSHRLLSLVKKEILNSTGEVYGGNFKYHMLAIVNALQDKNINAAKNIAYGLPKEFQPVAAKIIRDFAGFLDASEDYIFSAGEAEARNVVAREHLTPEQRRYTPPYKTSDVPQDKQIPTYLHVSDDSESDLLGKPETYDQSFNNNIRPADSFLSPEGQKQIERVRKKYQGTEQWMKAPNGKKTKLTEFQWLQVRTPNFKKWFGDWEEHHENASKVLDENGEPLIVWHGSDNKDFSIFDKQRISKRNDNIKGFFFAPDYRRDSVAGYYGHGNERPFFLNIRNPFIASPDEIKKTARHTLSLHDGIISIADNDFAPRPFFNYRNDVLDHENVLKGNVIEFIAFEPQQIKSANSNNGEFNPNNPDVYHQIIGENGARDLDRAEGVTTRMDNLIKAKIMHKNKISPKNIKLATGWEFAPDNKWRYEIQDTHINSQAIFDAINRLSLTL